MSLCFLSLETNKIFNQLILKNLQENGFDGLSEALIIVFPFIEEYENITVSQLSKKVGYSRQAMHKNIKKLEEFDYIKLTELNQKEKSINFTTKGKELMSKANSFIKSVEKDISTLVGKEELEKYKNTQSKLFDYLNGKLN